MRLNSYEGKRLLALARGGDYAHAGETESIDLVWDALPKSPTQSVLDAGCGRVEPRLISITQDGAKSPGSISNLNQSRERVRSTRESSSKFVRLKKRIASERPHLMSFVVSTRSTRLAIRQQH